MANFKDVERIFHKNSFSLYELHERIKKDKITLIPDNRYTFQFRYKSMVIINILMNFSPKPVIAYEDIIGKLTIHDSTIGIIIAFLNDEFELRSEFDDLNGLKFSELSPRFKNNIEDYHLSFDVIPANLTDFVNKILL